MSKQKYTVTLADTATEAAPTGLETHSDVISVKSGQKVEDAALAHALKQGTKQGKHFLVVGIERGDA